MPFPLGFAVGMGVGIWAAAEGKSLDDIRIPLLLVDVGVTVATAVVTFSIAMAIAKTPGQQPATAPWPDSFPTNPPPPSDPNNPYQPPRI